jgi:polyisoprenoid-binding protein YceI
MKRRLQLLIAVPVALVVLVSAGTCVWINVLHDDPPARLSLETVTDAEAEATTTTAVTPAPTSTTGVSAAPSASPSPSGGVATTAAPGTGSPTNALAASSPSTTTVVSTSPDGVWRISSGSVAGYRIPEVLFGQKTEAVGRTEKVTGSITIAGSNVPAATFTVDMASVQSDDGRRDGQYRGLVGTSQFPTSTFTLTKPIALGAAPAAGRRVTANASGDLTLRGVTKPVTVEVQAEMVDGKVRVAGSIPVTFASFGVPNPSNSAASVGDTGTIELLLLLAKG